VEEKMNILKTAAASITALGLLTGAAAAQKTELSFQTHYGPETLSGKLIAQYVDDVQTMSGGEIEIEVFYSSSVVKSVETFDAAATGIIDCDMTGGLYQVGKNSAFQFAADITGAYATPYQQLSWLYYGGGLEKTQPLYNKYGMQLIGWFIYGQESLVSTRPLGSVADLQGFKFRAPPGMITNIFEKLGASPIVMDFTEIFTALETGIIDGADASGFANNVGLGLYDLGKHSNFPGFHSMPSDHLACNKEVWDNMPEKHRRIMEVAIEKLALRNSLAFEVKNAEAVAAAGDNGVTVYAWSEEELDKFRAAATEEWVSFADTPEAKDLVESHKSFMKKLGIIK
jgi:TRAP-type mannitol/chloroaromatic compound transport system substrate-binding protein